MPTVREAKYSDQAEIAKVCTAAFWKNELFGEVIHPHREQYPSDNDFYWLRRYQVNWWDYTHRFLVTTETDSEGKEIITGVAQWARFGKGGKNMECWKIDPRNLAKPIATIYTKIASRIWPNRAADPVLEDVVERSYPYLDHVWTGPREECWYLESLAVHPDHQNKGNGRALVKWGLDQAEREGVCASVISAVGKEAFYQRCGFDTQEGRAGMGEGNPLFDVPGGLIFFRDVKK